MNVRKLAGIILLLAGLLWAAGAVPGSGYLIVSMPIGTVAPDSMLWIQWVGPSRAPLQPAFPAPDSGFIYYSRSPGGGKLTNYPNRVNNPYSDVSGGNRTIDDNIYTSPTVDAPVARRGTAFIPSQQTDMAAGVFYCVVALPLANDTIVSNEFEIMVESKDKVNLVAPMGTITQLTPTFSWVTNPGVPYYHLVLSDEPISINTDSTVKLDGLSIVWQAITSQSQIVYGVPDPSGFLTAAPPPLSPGTHYTWIVLNNYGNNPAFSSLRSFSKPGEFTLAGTALKRPVNTYPNGVNLTSLANKTFSFKWTNLDTNANTYQIYVYVTSDFSGVLAGVNAKMAVWQTEVRASKGDTMSVPIDAASILTSNRYTWRIMAIDAKGAGTAGDTTSFSYSAPTGTMGIYTRENIPVLQSGRLDTVVSAVGLVQAEVQVLDGSMEAPLLFYTDNTGNLERTRPVGTYRVTMVKDGYQNLSKTIVLGENAMTRDTFYMQRPESQIYGKVVDESNIGINLATVWGVSDRNDTESAKTDGLGNFVLNCYGADWQVWCQMSGYRTTLQKKTTVAAGGSFNFGTVAMIKNPFTLSGVIENSDRQPLLGAHVRLFRDGALLDEQPATPQSGVFSFAVPAGTYTVTAEKVGFTSYADSVQVVNTMTITILMAPHATLVSGFIFGMTCIGNDSMLAPIPGASVSFVKIGATDTVMATFDPVYGNFFVSLPGSQAFRVRSSAPGFAPKFRNDTLFTGVQSNVTFNDTLRSFAMLSGTVKMSASGAAIGNAGVSLINVVTAAVGATAASSANGYFELRLIADGKYLLHAGKDGLMLDSIQGVDTLVVANGRPNAASVALTMKPGDKTIKWFAKGTPGPGGSIKVQSPIVKSIGFSDSLIKAGPGVYIVNVDATPDSVVDLAYHRFSVPDSAVVFIDTVTLDVLHRHKDTLVPVNGLVNLAIWAADSLDSAAVFFKDADAAAWQSVVMGRRALAYTFSVQPLKDGSVLQYYFKAWRGADIYGYDKETYYCFIAPDMGRLTKFEMAPWSADTLLFPAACDIAFVFRGYCGSSFIPATGLDSSAMNWALGNAPGCVLKGRNGTSVTLTTSASKLSTPGLVTLTLDTTKIHVKAGLGNSLSAPFLATGSRLKNIIVKRVDVAVAQPISTSLADKAEFTAQGVDAAGTLLTLSPQWSIVPPTAGAISSDGTFRPDSGFLGFVRVFAKSGAIAGEYTTGLPGAPAGLNVINVINGKAAPDTISNKSGVSLIFPPHAVGPGTVGMLQLSVPNTDNLVKRGMFTTRMVDSNAYDFSELTNVTFTFAPHDSIRLVMDVPTAMTGVAASGKRKLYLAYWNPDSLLWDVLSNSIVSPDGKTVSAGLSHFSTYAIVSPPPTLSVDFSVSPNPFSPKVRPQGSQGPLGTCIAVRAETPEVRLSSLDLRIYNLTGDMVWGVQIQNALPQTYSIWWDGTTTDRVEPWKDANNAQVLVNGKNLCRNGRYFAVLVVTDFNNKENRYMKPIILVK